MGEVIQFPAHRMGTAERYVDKQAVAAYLGRTTRWIEQQYRNGLPHYKDGPSRLVRFKLSEIDRWMHERRAS